MAEAQAQVQGVDVGKLAELVDRLATSIYSYTAASRLHLEIEPTKSIRMAVGTKVEREGASLVLTVAVYVHDLDDRILYETGYVEVKTKRAELEGALAEVARRVTEAHASVDDVKDVIVRPCSEYRLNDLIELFIDTKATLIELSKMTKGIVTLGVFMCVERKDVMVRAYAIHPEFMGDNTDVIDYFVLSNGM